MPLPAFDARVAGLRRAFDQTFAARPPEPSKGHVNLLALRVGGDPCVVFLRDISGILRAPRIASVPGAPADVIGVAGVRGSLVPVFALASLLGQAVQEPPRWLLMCEVDEPLAFAVPAIDGYLQLPESRLHTHAHPADERPHVSQVAETDAGIRPVINIAHIVTGIRARVGHTALTR